MSSLTALASSADWYHLSYCQIVHCVDFFKKNPHAQKPCDPLILVVKKIKQASSIQKDSIVLLYEQGLTHRMAFSVQSWVSYYFQMVQMIPPKPVPDPLANNLCPHKDTEVTLSVAVVESNGADGFCNHIKVSYHIKVSLQSYFSLNLYVLLF